MSSFGGLSHSQQIAANNHKVSSMIQDSFFSAVEDEDIKLVREMLAKGADVNALGPLGTALYRAAKLDNLQISKLLVEKGADCNIIQVDFNRNEKHPEDDVFDYCCFIRTPIDFLCCENGINNQEILKYLLENRPRISENMIKERIRYCKQLFDDKYADVLFDYAASYLLRENMYDHLWTLGEDAIPTMLAALHNHDASFQNKPLDEGGTHEATLTIIIRSLLEQLVRFELRNGSDIEPEQYDDIFRELRHNLETYNLLRDIFRIPEELFDSFCPSIVENIIKKLKNMKNKEEFTLPITWKADTENVPHAICLNFICERDPDTIAIRIDNLNIWEAEEHKNDHIKDSLVMIPKIIGEIPLKELDHYKDYVKSLVICMREPSFRKNVIETLYHNMYLKNLDTNKVSTTTLTNQLVKQ
jgi:hypothetical protein